MSHNSVAVCQHAVMRVHGALEVHRPQSTAVGTTASPCQGQSQHHSASVQQVGIGPLTPQQHAAAGVLAATSQWLWQRMEARVSQGS